MTSKVCISLQTVYSILRPYLVGLPNSNLVLLLPFDAQKCEMFYHKFKYLLYREKKWCIHV